MQTISGVSLTSEANREEFAELSRLARGRGLLERRGGYYAVKIGATTGALAVLVVAAVVVGNSWWNLVVAVGVAVALTQVGFIGHDAGHHQICRRRRDNNVIGLISANLLTGFSFGWWLTKHNRHHAHTNRPGKDPDVDAGAFAFTDAQLEERGRVGKSVARIQAFLLVPLLFLEAMNMHVSSVVALMRRRDRRAVVEAGLLAVHGFVFFVAPFLIMSPVRAVVFVAVTQLLNGFYLGVSFVTNHVGMPTLSGGDDLGFLRRQVITSRNLSGRVFTGFVFGGLDTQIEHHLFPTMPRANLRRARELVRPFCADRAIPYVEESPFRAYGDVLRYLAAAGAGRSVGGN
ncbi:MAG: acyl-CoA desaturase [Actinobacteria bacterium]|nr:acyl-CoA desaturase [Actinomycetota bacterium]